MHMVYRAFEILNEADAVLHYNGQRFDEPVVNTEIAQAGYCPPSPYGHIDLYKTVRSRFAFMSNSLGYVSRNLGTETKVSHEGFQLWVRVLAGDVEARKLMRVYNIGDVHANEALYERLRPWIDHHPSVAVIKGTEDCPACGSSRIQKRGYAYTQVSKFQRYVCLNCGKWSRSGKRIDHVDIREVAA